jgi:hypothetical protein
MKMAARANSFADSLATGFAVDREVLTRGGSGVTMSLTTPPTPLHDAHQGGYSLGRPSRCGRSAGAGHE